MDPDLDILIEHYREEQLRLEKLIAKHTLEQDYEFVNLNNVALEKVSMKIDLLMTLKDPLFREKKRLEFAIKNLDHLTGEDNSAGSSMWSLVLENLTNELETLKNQPLTAERTGHELDDAILDVMEGIHKGFRLPIRQDDVYIEFRKNNNFNYLISVVREINHRLDCENINSEYEDELIMPLSAIGFTLNPVNDHYELIYPAPRVPYTNEIKTIFARILFDVFNFHIEKNTVIQTF